MRILNAIAMYIYLIYYTERLRRDRNFMFREASKQLKINHRTKILQYQRDFKWRV